MDREAWHAAIHGVTKSRTWLSNWTELMVVLCLIFWGISVLFFHNGYTSLHLPNSPHGFSFLHTLTNIFFYYYLSVISVLTNGKSCLILVMTYFSLMISDVEHFFMCLLTICMSSLDKSLCRSSASSLFGLFVYLMLSCIISFWYIWLTYIFWILTLYLIYHLHISSPI